MHEPGLDYFERLEAHFAKVRRHRSDEVDPTCQPFVHAPTDTTTPLLIHKPSIRLDIIPICLTSKL